jgi:hypothetical protein
MARMAPTAAGRELRGWWTMMPVVEAPIVGQRSLPFWRTDIPVRGTGQASDHELDRFQP